MNNYIYRKMIFSLFLFLSQFLFVHIFIISMGKGIVGVCKHIKRNCSYPYPNTAFIVPPCSVYIPQKKTLIENCAVTSTSQMTSTKVSYCIDSNNILPSVSNNEYLKYFVTGYRVVCGTIFL